METLLEKLKWAFAHQAIVEGLPIKAEHTNRLAEIAYRLSNEHNANTVLCGEGINVASTVSIPYGYNNTVTVAKPPSTPTAPLLREGVATEGISSAPEGY